MLYYFKMSVRIGLRLFSGIFRRHNSISASLSGYEVRANRNSKFESKSPFSSKSVNIQYPVKKSQVSSESLHHFAQKLNWTLSSEDLLINALTHKSYVSQNYTTLGSSFEHNERLVFLGYQITSTFLAEILYFKYPTLTEDQLWDLQNGLLQHNLLADCGKNLGLHNLIFSKDVPITDQIIAETLLAVLGSLYMDQAPSLTRQFVKDNIVPDLSDDKIKEICQLEHAKFMLHMLYPKGHGSIIQARVLEKSVKKDIYGEEIKEFKVGIYNQDEQLAVGQGYSQLQAEKNACKICLKENYLEVLKNAQFPLQYEEYIPESELNFGLLGKGVRYVEIAKGHNGFGFLIKGGEMKTKETQNYVKYSYYVPPFVSGIIDRGCQDVIVGDVILAINDKNTKGMSHKMVVDLLGSIDGKVKLTVKNSKKVLIFDELETNFLKFKEDKLLSQLTNPEWSEWHQAHARENEEKYTALSREEVNRQ